MAHQRKTILDVPKDVFSSTALVETLRLLPEKDVIRAEVRHA